MYMYFEIDHDNDTNVVKTLTFVQLIEKAYVFVDAILTRKSKALWEKCECGM